MVVKEGVVTSTEIKLARVKAIDAFGCVGCVALGKACRLCTQIEREVETVNFINASVGDRVQFYFNTRKLMFILFFIYVFPVLMLIAGSLIGHMLSAFFSMNESVASVLGGSGAFCLSFLLIRSKSVLLAEKENWYPQIIRIVGKGNSSSYAER